MKNDIVDRADIERMITEFYTRVRSDQEIGDIFAKANIDWPKHLPVMYDFWDGIIFNKGNYKGNTLGIHQDLHRRIPLAKENFTRWLALFTQTVDELFSGEKAELVKQRANSIALVMQMKIL